MALDAAFARLYDLRDARRRRAPPPAEEATQAATLMATVDALLAEPGGGEDAAVEPELLPHYVSCLWAPGCGPTLQRVLGAAARQLAARGAPPLDVNCVRLDDGLTAMHRAVEDDNAEALQVLLAAGGDPNCAATAPDGSGGAGESLFRHAAAHGAPACVRLLLAPRAGEPPVVVTGGDADGLGRSALHYLILNHPPGGDDPALLALVAATLDAGADACAADDEGGTPLGAALAAGCTSGALPLLLLARGAALSAREAPRALRALLGASDRLAPAVVQLAAALLACGALANPPPLAPAGGRFLLDDRAPLSDAVCQRDAATRVGLVRLLLAAGADVHAADGSPPQPPLVRAASAGALDAVAALLAAGASVNAAGGGDGGSGSGDGGGGGGHDDGAAAPTALAVAIARRDAPLAALLLAAGAHAPPQLPADTGEELRALVAAAAAADGGRGRS